MAQLRRDYDKFIDRQAEVIAVGPEDAQTFADYWHKEKMPFTGIADHEHVIAGFYGQKVNPLKFGRMPALVVVDKAGKMRYAHYGDSMSDIPSNQDILTLLDNLNKES
ncbi:MAG: thioredoxin peroxidase [Chloroflexi bacterium RBG_13_48_17]|nr:MAG: thioredoxin peroxidase [Chloroflexi bacterium RBG_13_48_17]